MFNKLKLFNIIRGVLNRFSSQRAAVAMIIALSTPMLIAATGLSVDIGYWYQQQATLQSAADAAALAAATSNANSNYNVTVANFTAAQPYALGAANGASNSQFGLTNASVTLAATSSTVNGATINAWTAKATIPRASFFSTVRGMGLTGMLSGSQSASATADVKTVSVTSGGSCLLALSSSGNSSIGTIGTNGNATVDATSCSITADSNACNGQNSAITATGNATIKTTSTTGPSIITAGCTFTSGNATIMGAGGNSSNNENVSTGAAVETDPLSFMGDPPTFWETTPVGTASGDIPACTVILSIVSPGPCVFTSSQMPSGNATLTFTGGSYFFPSGFSASGNANVNFGPGIYYFNGNFNISGNGNYTTTNILGTTIGGTIGATFVLEGTKSSYDISGNASGLNLSAPTSNCVAPANYNSAPSFANNNMGNPYNLAQLENGKGICGILIYQARNDPSSGTISGNGTDTINGIIYAPDASFSSSGNGSVSATNGGTLAVLASKFTVSGNGQLNIAINSTDTAGEFVKPTTTTTVTTLLVQ